MVGGTRRAGGRRSGLKRVADVTEGRPPVRPPVVWHWPTTCTAFDSGTKDAILRFVQDIPLEADHPSYATLLQIEQGLAHLADKPVLICWGEQDFIFNTSFLLRWLHFFPHAQVHRIAQAGHYVMEDAAGTVRLLVEDFVKEH